nr:neuropeptide F receptor-like [Cherax quadricarinatus]
MVDAAHQVVYRGVMPVLVCLGLLANSLCGLILIKPSFTTSWVNRYFLVLVVSDLLVCVFTIPIITTINGCTSSSYFEAKYYAHFGWSLFALCQSVETYTIMWLAMDRFMAVWMYQIYPRIQKKPNFMLIRMIVTIVLCILFHLVYMIKSEVKDAVVDGIPYDNSKNESNIQECIGNKTAISDGFHYEYKTQWHEIYRYFYSWTMKWLPSCLILVFNASLVFGVVIRRIKFRAAKESGKRRERNLIILSIALAASHILLTLPITVYFIKYGELQLDRCCSNLPRDLFLHVANILQLLESIIPIMFQVALNHNFKKELKILLKLEERTIDSELSTRN